MASGGEEDGFTGPHPVEPRASTAILPPVLTKVVDADPLCWLTFTQEAIMTSCKSGTSTLPDLRVAFSAFLLLFCPCPTSLTLTGFKGHIRTWNRPSDSKAQVGKASAN